MPLTASEKQRQLQRLRRETISAAVACLVSVMGAIFVALSVFLGEQSREEGYKDIMNIPTLILGLVMTAVFALYGAFKLRTALMRYFDWIELSWRPTID